MRSITRALVALGFLILSAVSGAAEWQSLGPDVGRVNDLAVDPANPDTMYAATGVGGVWRSEDGGATWVLPGVELVKRAVVWVEVDPSNSTTLWAGVEILGGHGLWRSTDRGATWKPVVVGATFRPLSLRLVFAPSDPKVIYVPSGNPSFRSSDGGETWSSFRVADHDAYTFAVHAEDSMTLLAGGSLASFSRSLDGGETWGEFGEGLPEGGRSLSQLTLDPRNPSTLYVISGRDLYKSTDLGDSWAPMGVGHDVSRVALDPSDSQVLWVTSGGGLQKSTDGGASWSRSDRGTGRYVVKDVAFHPSGVIFAAGDSGLFRSTDGGASWSSFGKGLATGWAQKLWAGPDALFAQLSVGLFRREGSGQWKEIRQPLSDGGDAEIEGIVFDHGSSKTVYAFTLGALYRSADRGVSWSEVEQKALGLRAMMKGAIELVQFKSLIQDPGSPKTLYAGSWSNDSAVLKTTDGGKKWAPAAAGLPKASVDILRSLVSGTVYAVLDEEGVYRTTNGGGRWSGVSSGLPDAKILELAIDPTDPSRLFAATEEGLFRSTDGGSGWSRTSEGIEGDEVRAVAVAGDGTAYAGTFEGVFRSGDGGSTWTSMNEGLPNASAHSLAIQAGSPRMLYVGTGAAGVWATELP